MSDLRLVIFDVDGTLVDSQADILAAMAAAFGGAGLSPPPREAVLGIVGLSLPEAFARLAPETDAGLRAAMVEGYKDAYAGLRLQGGVAASSPLYPGVAEMLRGLAVDPSLLLGIATGKSRRGLDKLLDGHDLRRLFVTQQCADDHPSKPHPAMIEAALAETGVPAEHAVMVGDTSFDMEMAAAAGVAGIGVSWGYHPAERLSAARIVIDEASDLRTVLCQSWRAA